MNFSRTSAADEGERSGIAPPNAAAGAARPHYNVDDFKRLLLTGETSVAEASAPSTPSTHSQGTQNLGDSSSSTDASSISRHSIFEPLSGANQDTPRTSHEVSPSGDEPQLPGQKSSPRMERIRPAAPKPRHGNPMTGAVPQPSSFQNPMLSFQPANNSKAAHSERPTPSSPRTPTNLNKPLPLPPALEPLEHRAQESALFTRKRPQSAYFEYQSPQPHNLPTKRDPPAPPLARRHSQLRPKSSIGSAGRSTRIPEENLVDAKPQPQRNPIVSLEAPAPPPPRRSGRTRSLSTASTSSSVSAFRALPTTSTADDEHPKSSKSPPPVPPTRTPSISSVKRPPRPSLPTNSSPTVVPPVPPRRRGSSHSSLTQSKTTAEYSTKRSRGNSGDSSILAFPTTPSESGVEGIDVLANLTALQREVDELRGKLK